MTSSSRHGTTAISVSGIRFSYGTRTILDDVSLTVNYGEVVGLLGPNGTGKSTLVGIMAGDLEPQSGSVAYHGKDLTDFARRELAQTRSIMPQTIEFPFSYMVHDIVAMGRQCWDTDPDKDHKIVAQSLIRTDVGGFETRDVTRLSGGEKARVTLARVLAQEASVVFLDEPTAALDIAHQERTMKICRELAAAGHAVIAVMHDLQLAAAHCDRIALMSSGSIAAYDVPDVVLNSELLSRVYDWPITVARVADGRLVILPE
ncbi:heme ABC transporter ATP-binding protein [Arcanobacterium phocae]|uniref:heme ABC transporter ATP-binding protein n=1 Tax=Arcanobacterium phocae TaxID=131112 RepID=UPI001C0F344B|nr:heme ABC transporter ATP-binding protein [Arcanobacterium phocae]